MRAPISHLRAVKAYLLRSNLHRKVCSILYKTNNFGLDRAFLYLDPFNLGYPSFTQALSLVRALKYKFHLEKMK